MTVTLRFFFIISYISLNKCVLILLLKVIKQFLFCGEWGGVGENISVFTMQILQGEGDVDNLGRVTCEGRRGRKPPRGLRGRPDVEQAAEWEGCKILRVQLKISFIYLISYPRPVFTNLLTAVSSFLTLAHAARGRELYKILCL